MQSFKFNLQNGFQTAPTCSEPLLSVAELIKDQVKMKEHNMSKI